MAFTSTDTRRTKMVCTLGPSTSSPEAIRALILAGMDVARFNFSHGDHATHRARFQLVRRVAEEVGRNVAILMDLQGPKIRTGRLLDGVPIELGDGQDLIIEHGDWPGDATLLSTSYAQLAEDVKPGDRIMVSDGRLELRVTAIDGSRVRTTVVRGGVLAQNQGINLPGVRVSAPSLTDKDLDDLTFGLALGFDYVALSFVRGPEDVATLADRIRRAGKTTPIVAKIERPEAVASFDAILDIADAVMVARGDLGVEVNLEEVPHIQKDLIRRCNDRSRPVIVATQMLESMISASRPTRAEVADVANAIYDGADAVMLSGETAAGAHPIEAARVMTMVARTTDEHIMANGGYARRRTTGPRWQGEEAFGPAIGEAVRSVVETLEVRRIVCFTRSGKTAATIAALRPRTPITAITHCEETRRRCALCWGVEAVTAEDVALTVDMACATDRVLLDGQRAGLGDTVVIAAGMPSAIEGRTNVLKLHRVGESAHVCRKE